MNTHFASLIIGLAHQADSALQGNLPPGAEAAGATDGRQIGKSLIDTVAMLEEKTKGNLDDDEAKLIADVLTRLKFAFVQGTK